MTPTTNKSNSSRNTTCCDCPTSVASPLHAEPSARVDTSIQALRLIPRLSCSSGSQIQARRCRARDHSYGSPIPDEPQRYLGESIGDCLIGMEYVLSPTSSLSISIINRVLSSCPLAYLLSSMLFQLVPRSTMRRNRVHQQSDDLFYQPVVMLGASWSLKKSLESIGTTRSQLCIATLGLP